MPEFLDNFINTTIPELWEKANEFFGESIVNAVIVAATLLVCIILAIAVHRANKRDRKYAEKLAAQSAGEKSADELPAQEEPALDAEIEETEKIEEVLPESENQAHPIIMEKIELKREEHHPSIMSYNTSRKGTTFTEDDLKKVIKD